MDLDLFLEDDEDIDAFILIVYGIPRRLYTRADYFNTFDELTFFQRFRLSKDTTMYLLQEIEDVLEFPYNLNQSVAPINQLLIFLRYCATGSHLSAVGDFAGVHLSTVSRIIGRVSAAIASLYRQHIKFPATAEEITFTQTKFYEIARFPRVIGAVDCTHVKIQSPGGNDAEIFRNRKGYFSCNIQVICNSNLEALDVVARWPGSSHDATIFNNSTVRQSFEANRWPNAILLGDSGYYLRPYLLTPLLNPVTPIEQLYNQSHIRTRNVIERFFGILKRRFPVLAYGCRVKLETVMALVVACVVLHNICRRVNEEEPPLPENEVELLRLINDGHVPHIPVHDDRAELGNIVRRNLVENYFANL